MSNLNEAIAEVIAAHEGRIGTHYEGCWDYHAGCLAVLVRDGLAEHDRQVAERAWDEGEEAGYDDALAGQRGIGPHESARNPYREKGLPL